MLRNIMISGLLLGALACLAITGPRNSADAPVIATATATEEPIPGPPHDLAFTAPGVLEWSAPSSGDPDHYTVYGSMSASFDEAAVILYHLYGSCDVTEWPFPYYFVTAANALGEESAPVRIGNPAMALSS